MELKRYVRTKDGIIWEYDEKSSCCLSKGKCFYNNKKTENDITNTSDNILSLIKNKDLIKLADNDLVYEVIENNIEVDGTIKIDSRELNCDIDELSYITKIYTKQGNNYILVARKNKKGWEVL